MYVFKGFCNIIVLILQIFFHLLKLYLAQPDPNNIFMPKDTQPNMKAALHILNLHSDKIDLVEVCPGAVYFYIYCF